MNKKVKLFPINADQQGMILPLFALILVSAMIMMALVVDHSKESLSLESLQRTSDSAALAGARKLDGTERGWHDAKNAALLALKQNPIHGIPWQGLTGLTLDQGPNGWWGVEQTVSAPEPLHTGTQGSHAGLDVTVERGMMWYNQSLNNDLGGYQFLSLEDGTADYLNNGQWMGVIQSYMIANAVRISVNLQSLPTVFGKVMGFYEFKDLQRKALAVSDSELEFEVAPLAIPYCQLLLDTNPHVMGEDENHQNEAYVSSEQQKRELIFTESNPKRNLAEWDAGSLPQVLAGSREEMRREGITRFESYVGKAYSYFSDSADSPCFSDRVSGPLPNCKYLTLFGGMGKPTESPGQTTQVEEMEGLFDAARQGTLKAKLGGYFAPLENITQGGHDISRAADEISRFIEEGNLRFHQAFTEGESANFQAKANFPYLRTVRPYQPAYASQAVTLPDGSSQQIDIILNDHQRRPSIWTEDQIPENDHEDYVYDLRLSWPSWVEGVDEPIWIDLLMDHQKKREYSSSHLSRFNDGPGFLEDTRIHGRWTNPLCHTGTFPGNNLDQAVRRVRVMVVAPQNPEHDYCDFNAVFNHSVQKSSPPVMESRPVVVGAVEVDIFDANVRDLDEVPQFVAAMNAARLPDYGVYYKGLMRRRVSPTYPGILDPVDARNPGELEMREDFLRKLEDNQEQMSQAWFTCTETEGVPPGCDTVDDQSSDDTCNYPQCNGAAQKVQNGAQQLASSFPSEFYECFDLEPVIALLMEIDTLAGLCLMTGGDILEHKCMGGNKKTKFQNLLEKLKSLLKDNIRTRNHAHCLNQLRPGQFNPWSPNSYERLKPLWADRGCGGLRGRLVHDPSSTKVWATGSSLVDASPALVHDDG